MHTAASRWRRPLKRVLESKSAKPGKPRDDGVRRGARHLADVPIERSVASEHEAYSGPPAGIPRSMLAQPHDRPVAIVIPVFNAYQEVRRCLDHVRRHTPARHPIIVIDNASSDPHIVRLLAEFAGTVGAQVVTHEVNQGLYQHDQRRYRARGRGGRRDLEQRHRRADALGALSASCRLCDCRSRHGHRHIRQCGCVLGATDG